MGSGSLGAPGSEADVQRVTTCASLIRWRARLRAWSKPIGPCGGSGTYRTMSCSRQTTSWRSDSASGRAMDRGTGVTSPIQWLESVGVSTGTGTITRRGSPATRA
ncbi:hypothetical protein SMICM17S_10413 [Streptomyces microflavus]